MVCYSLDVWLVGFFKMDIKVSVIFSSSTQTILTASKLSHSKELWSSELKPELYYVDNCQLQTYLNVTHSENSLMSSSSLQASSDIVS